jgi:IclR family KDG regulon transcriptional repressor
MLGMYSRVGTPCAAALHGHRQGPDGLGTRRPAARHILKGCDFKRYREKTITTREGYEAELERTLAQGFGQDREEFDDHIRCAAIPIFDRLNQVVAG